MPSATDDVGGAPSAVRSSKARQVLCRHIHRRVAPPDRRGRLSPTWLVMTFARARALAPTLGSLGVSHLPGQRHNRDSGGFAVAHGELSRAGIAQPEEFDVARCFSHLPNGSLGKGFDTRVQAEQLSLVQI